jgi:L-methionine (R)-S-oxide reductase
MAFCKGSIKKGSMKPMTDKTEKYEQILQQIEMAFDPELDTYTNMNHVLAILKYSFGWFWVGYYVLKGNSLYLGPYQGMIACYRIEMGKGVCGTAASTKKTMIVDDVTAYEGYIACHAEPKSEIVVPGIKNDKLMFVLDIDDIEYGAFDETDKLYLEKIVNIIVSELF